MKARARRTDFEDFLAMTFATDPFLLGRAAPDAYRIIAGSGRQPATIGRKGDILNLCAVLAVKRFQFALVCQIPAADTAKSITSYQGTAIWINGHTTGGNIALPFQSAQAFAGPIAQAGHPGFRQAKASHR